jgi:glutathione S-transferase
VGRPGPSAVLVRPCASMPDRGQANPASKGTIAPVDFYYGRVSGNSARAAFGLHEAGAHYAPHHVYTPSGENRSPPYLAINPVGTVPALTDGELRLWESNAINWYAAETHPESRLLPASVAGRAAVQRWLFFQTGHVSPACASVFRATNTRMQKFWNIHGDSQSLETGRRELARYLIVLEQALTDREWLEGAFSIADVAYAPHLWLVAEGGHDFASTPAVQSWLERLWARPAWRKTAALIFGV